MLWIAPSEKGTNSAALEKRLWDAADQFRANTGLKSQEYSAPDLLIPPDRLLKKFGEATIPMAEQIHALYQKIQNLRRIRDLLLPRRLSGPVNF
jgi:hypothetical protein